MNDALGPADRRCIYCQGATGDAQFSEEHIWPQSLGGDVAPADFITRDVCKTCNDRCGLWVDAGFTKSFLASTDALRGAELFLDPDRPGPLPLIYMGVDVEFECAPDEICERWTGPSGEHVYHVHLRDDQKWDAYAGGDILRRKRDPGRVYVYLTSSEEFWALTGLVSVAMRFPGAKRRCLTIVNGISFAPHILAADEGPISDVEAREIAFIRGRPLGPKHGQFVIQIDATERFLAKLALGFGHTLLGPSVSSSPYADDLRRRLWPRRSEEPAEDRIRGAAGVRGQDDPFLARFLGVEGAWTLSFRAMPEGFIMSLATPGLKLMHIALSDDPSLWPPDAITRFADGETYVMVPPRRMVVGPIEFGHFLAHQLDGPREPRLAELDALKANAARRPPKRPQPKQAT